MKKYGKNEIFSILLLCDAALVASYVVTNYMLAIPSWTIKHWFDLNAEQNIPTWFSTIQLLFIAFLCFVYGCELKQKVLRRFYGLATVGFGFLSADEASKIHEGISSIVRKSHILHAPLGHVQLWMLIYPIAATLLAGVFWREIRAFLCERTGNSIFFAGISVYLTGVIVLEGIGLYFIPPGAHLLNVIEVSFEEGFEMLGQSIMGYALLAKLDAMGVAEKRADAAVAWLAPGSG